MTCIARPLAFFLLVVAAAMIAVGMVSIVISVLAVTAVSVLGTIMAVRIIVRTHRSRAASGACTTCRHPCQGRPVVFIDETSLSILPPRWPDIPATSASQAELARLVATGRR